MMFECLLADEVIMTRVVPPIEIVVKFEGVEVDCDHTMKGVLVGAMARVLHGISRSSVVMHSHRKDTDGGPCCDFPEVFNRSGS